MSLIEKLFGVGIPAWVVEVIAVLALVGGGILYFEHRGASGELAKLQASSTKLIAKAQGKIAAEAKRHQSDNAANQEKLNDALVSNNDLTTRLASSLRDFEAYRRAHPDVPRPTSGPVAASSGECGARSCGDLAEELAVRGNELAGSVGELSANLSACQRDRDSLTGLP